MAAKKSSSKQVTITMDESTRKKLSDAMRVLADVGNALDVGADDAGRAGGAKRAKKRAKK